MSLMPSWCLDECPQSAAAVRDDDDDDQDDDQDPFYSPSYSSWHRIALWAQNVDPSPPLAPPIYTSPSKRILTPQHPTACLTSDSPASLKPHASPPRPARSSPTATESLVASSTCSPSPPISLSGFVRSWAPRPHLPRLTTANFTVFAKAHPSPPPAPLLSDHTDDGDVSPVWWVSAPDPDSSTSSRSQHLVIQRAAPSAHPSRGRKRVRAVA
ncbi:hypothetical protein B0H10DRAFT_2005398 [Mycena sp. CBHHK59/15]|nr:hypothetical protein B0H10DRAFT_2005398 [Mycena sp. CBHHK59/15]